jgi:hypothetical protein
VKSTYIIYFWSEIGLFLVCLNVEKNVGMPENYRFVMDYEYQEKKRRKSTSSNISCSLRNLLYILSIRFHKIFFVREYQLSYNFFVPFHTVRSISTQNQILNMKTIYSMMVYI